jgi:hypothetical protein
MIASRGFAIGGFQLWVSITQCRTPTYVGFFLANYLSLVLVAKQPDLFEEGRRLDSSKE